MISRNFILLAVGVCLLVAGVNAKSGLSIITQSLLNGVTATLKSVFAAAISIVNGGGNVASTGVQSVLNLVSNILEQVLCLGDDVFDLLKGPISVLLSTLLGGIRDLVAVLLGQVSALLNQLVSGVDDTLDDVLSALGSVLGQLGDLIAMIVGLLSNVLSTVLSGSSSADGVNDLIAGFLNSLVGILQDVGQTLTQVLQNDNITQSINDTASGIICDLKTLVASLPISGCTSDICQQLNQTVEQFLDSL